MMKITQNRRKWYTISLSMLSVGVIALAAFGLQLGIDFTGGSEFIVETQEPESVVEDVVRGAGVEDFRVTSPESSNEYQVRFQEDNDNVEPAFAEAGIDVIQFERVGPSVSADLVRNALISLVVVSIAITLYVAFAFRKVEHPMRFGAMAIVALLHDALFVLSLFAVFGFLFGTEVDAFLVTAILTVIGFSVHDTIVVFDRIRENLLRRSGELVDIVNMSVNEVFVRSLNTSITTVVVLLALFLFGGASTANFMLALLLGMLSGVYSSIFIAASLLVSWDNFLQKRGKSSKTLQS